MTTTEVVKILAKRLNLTQTQTRQLLQKTLVVLKDTLTGGKSYSIRGFGTFGIRKRSDRRSYNPNLKKWMRLPPQIIVSFKAGSKLKRRVKQRKQQ